MPLLLCSCLIDLCYTASYTCLLHTTLLCNPLEYYDPGRRGDLWAPLIQQQVITHNITNGRHWGRHFLILMNKHDIGTSFIFHHHELFILFQQTGLLLNDWPAVSWALDRTNMASISEAHKFWRNWNPDKFANNYVVVVQVLELLNWNIASCNAIKLFVSQNVEYFDAAHVTKYCDTLRRGFEHHALEFSFAADWMELKMLAHGYPQPLVHRNIWVPLQLTVENLDYTLTWFTSPTSFSFRFLTCFLIMPGGKVLLMSPEIGVI